MYISSGEVGAVLGISDCKYMVERQVQYIALHCIALHRANRFLKLANEDEEMEIEVLLIALHTYECMYICTPHIACIIYIHEGTCILCYELCCIALPQLLLLVNYRVLSYYWPFTRANEGVSSRPLTILDLVKRSCPNVHSYTPYGYIQTSNDILRMYYNIV